MRALRAALAPAAALALACAHGPRSAHQRLQEVEVEGWASCTPQDKLLDCRRQALADALRRASEQGAGLRVSATSRLEQRASFSQKIETSSRGFVARYQHMSERQFQDMLIVRIRAWVGEEPRPGTLAAESLRVALNAKDKDLAAALGVALGDQGVTLDEAERCLWLAQGEVQAAVPLSQRFGIFRSYRVRVLVELRQSQDGLTWPFIEEAAAVAPTEVLARQRALDRAAQLLAPAMARRIRSFSGLDKT